MLTFFITGVEAELLEDRDPPPACPVPCSGARVALRLSPLILSSSGLLTWRGVDGNASDDMLVVYVQCAIVKWDLYFTMWRRSLHFRFFVSMQVPVKFINKCVIVEGCRIFLTLMLNIRVRFSNVLIMCTYREGNFYPSYAVRQVKVENQKNAQWELKTAYLMSRNEWRDVEYVLSLVVMVELWDNEAIAGSFGVDRSIMTMAVCCGNYPMCDRSIPFKKSLS